MKRHTIGALCALMASLALATGCQSAGSDKAEGQVPTSDGAVAYGPPAPGDPGAKPVTASASNETLVTPSGPTSSGHYDPSAAKHIEAMEAGLKPLEPIPTDEASLNATKS
jgi:hypothetical protein